MGLRHISYILIAVMLIACPGGLRAGEAGGNAKPGSTPEEPPQKASGAENGDAGLSMLESFARRLGLGSEPGGELRPIPTRDEICERMSTCSGCIVDTIIVRGNTRTRRETVVREMATRTGEPLDEELVYRDDSYLRGLGFFSSVDIKASLRDAGSCAVIVRVEERPGLFMKYPWPVIDYNVDSGVSLGMRWKVKNFRGAGEELYFSYRERPEEQRSGSFHWSAPYLWDVRMRLQVQLFSYYRIEEPDREDFLKRRTGGEVSLGLPLTGSRRRQLWLTPEISFEERVSRMTLEGNVPVPGDVFFRQTLASYGVSLVYDSRDNVISPMRGVFAGVFSRFFDTVRGHRQEYSFHTLISNVYIPVGPLGSLITGMRLTGREGDLPDFYRLRMGGKNDLRGFYDADLSGLFKMYGTLQLRRLLYGPAVFNLPLVGRFDLAVNGVVFIDHGALVEKPEDYADGKFFRTGGFGIEVLSPIQNLVRIELAFAENSDRPEFYITSVMNF